MAHILACPRTPVAKIVNLIPPKFIEALEHNQKIASCCRHPEHHEIEAWYSSEEQVLDREPNIYKFICTCGRTHARFCVGHDDRRPFWTRK